MTLVQGVQLSVQLIKQVDADVICRELGSFSQQC